MSKIEKFLDKLFRGQSDANISFADLCKIMKPKYEIILYWSREDDAYIAEVPELAGCMADGETYQEALHNAEIVINEWIETATALNRYIPEPKGKLMYA